MKLHSSQYLKWGMLWKWNHTVCSFLSLAYFISIMHFRFIHIIKCMRNSFHFYDGWRALYWTEILQFVFSFPNYGTFGLFLPWIIMNKADIYKITDRLLSEHVFSWLGQSSLRGIAGLYGKHMLNIVRNYHTVQCGCTILPTHQKRMRILVVLQVFQLLHFQNLFCLSSSDKWCSTSFHGTSFYLLL